MNTGSSNRLMYDKCSYQHRLYRSVAPLNYNLAFYKYENCDKCLGPDNRFYTRQSPEIVAVETELKNYTRPLSHCDRFKYSPLCKRSGLCISTFDRHVPVIYAPEICPIVHNNIPKQTHPGFVVPNPNIC